MLDTVYILDSRPTMKMSPVWSLSFTWLLWLGHAMANPTVPFDLPKFQDALSQCRLPCNGLLADDGIFGGVSSEYFKLVNETYMSLSMDKSVSRRCELRGELEWSTVSSAEAPITYHANLKVITPNSSVTFCQVRFLVLATRPQCPCFTSHNTLSRSTSTDSRA